MIQCINNCKYVLQLEQDVSHKQRGMREKTHWRESVTVNGMLNLMCCACFLGVYRDCWEVNTSPPGEMVAHQSEDVAEPDM